MVPGKQEKSRLYQYLAADSDPHMPPKKQLTDVQREAIREWIAAMATSQAKPAKTAKPRRFDSVTQAIDAFIAEGWKQSRVKPAAREFLSRHPEFVLERPPFAFNESPLRDWITYWPDG